MPVIKWLRRVLGMRPRYSPEELAEHEATRQRIRHMLARLPAERLREGDAALLNLNDTFDPLEACKEWGRQEEAEELAKTQHLATDETTRRDS